MFDVRCHLNKKLCSCIYSRLPLVVSYQNEKDNVLKSYFQGNNMMAYDDKKTVSDIFNNDEGLANDS